MCLLRTNLWYEWFLLEAQCVTRSDVEGKLNDFTALNKWRTLFFQDFRLFGRDKQCLLCNGKEQGFLVEMWSNFDKISTKTTTSSGLFTVLLLNSN